MHTSSENTETTSYYLNLAQYILRDKGLSTKDSDNDDKLILPVLEERLLAAAIAQMSIKGIDITIKNLSSWFNKQNLNQIESEIICSQDTTAQAYFHSFATAADGVRSEIYARLRDKLLTLKEQYKD
jgi:hypothetical protein